MCLEAGLRELQAQLQTCKAQSKTEEPVRDEQKRKSLGPLDQVAILECPSLDKLLAALDARVLGEDLDTSRFLKSRVDHLEVILVFFVAELRGHYYGLNWHPFYFHLSRLCCRFLLTGRVSILVRMWMIFSAVLPM